MLPLVASKMQGVFLKGRFILDRVFLCANECIDLRLKEGNAGVICKLDFG